MKRSTRGALILFCVAGSAADAGVYFAFATFVMQALKKLPTINAISAMQQINVDAVNVWFAIALFGTGLVSILLFLDALRHRAAQGRGPMILAAVVYLASLTVTFACNVPLNNQLAVVDPHSPIAGSAWVRFYDPWIFWNHTRTVLALASTVLFAISFRNYRKEGI